MRFPIQTPVPGVDAGARPLHHRASALAVAAVLVTSAALVMPTAAHADEQPVQDAPVVAAEAPAAPAPDAVEAPAPEGSETAVEQTPAPVEDAAAVEVAPAPAEEPTPEELAPIEKSVAVASAPEALAAPAGPAEAGAGEPVNQLPVAVDDHYQMVQDTTLTVDSPGFRINDYDPEGDWYGVDGIEPYLPEEFSSTHDGSFIFTPPAGFTGTRVFTYRLRTGAGDLSDPGTITIDVLPTGSDVDLPPIVDDETYSYLFNTPLYIAAPGVLANDTDPDGGELGVSLLEGPFEGTLELNADGSFLYTPQVDVGGSQWFRYRVCDMGGCADGEASLEQIAAGGTPSGPSEPPVDPGPQNLPPVAEPDALAAVAGDLAILDAPGVLANDADPEGQPLSLVGVTVPDHGVLYHWAADGGVQYVPNEGFTGTDQIEYTVSDGLHTSTSTVTFTVTAPANHAPQAWEDEVTMAAGTTLAVDAPGVLGNDSDQDGDALTVGLYSVAQHGTIDVAEDGGFTYTPDAGFVGTEHISYSVSDGVASSSAILSIHVAPAGAPLAPSALGDHYTAMSGALLDVPAPGVLGNDLAPSGPVAVVGHEPAEHGTIEIDPDGSLRYTSDPGYTGVDTVRYTISDGESSADALLSITVLGTSEECGVEEVSEPFVTAIAIPSDPGPTEPCDEPGEPGESEQGEPEEPGMPGSSEPGRPAEDHTPLADHETATTGAAALAETGADASLYAALAALLAALGIALRLRRRAADH